MKGKSRTGQGTAMGSQDRTVRDLTYVSTLCGLFVKWIKPHLNSKCRDTNQTGRATE